MKKVGHYFKNKTITTTNNNNTMINMNSNGLTQLPLVGKLSEFVNMAQKQQADCKRKCYICKRKGHIAKYCKMNECKICHKKHDSICQHKINQMLVDITNRMNDNFLHDYNYINYKIAVLQRKLNRKQIKAQQIKMINDKKNKEKFQIIKDYEYQYTSKIDRFNEVAKNIKNQEFKEKATFTIKRCLKNQNTVITRKNCKDYYKLKSNQRLSTPEDIDMKGTCQYYLQNEINDEVNKAKKAMEKKYDNKETISVITQEGLLYLDSTAYIMEEGFFATKSNLYLSLKCEVRFNVRITPSKIAIEKLLANKVYEGKVKIRINANKFKINAVNQAPKCGSIKKNIKEYSKLKNYYELLFKKIEIDEMIDKKSTLLMQINKQINEARKQLQNTKNMICNEKKIRKKLAYQKIKKELKITELNNKLQYTKSKIDRAKNIAESRVRQEFKLNHAEIEANLRKQQQLLSQKISQKKEIIQRQRAIIKKNKESDYYYDDNDAGESYCHCDVDSD